MASNFIYVFLKYTYTGRKFSIWIKALFRFLIYIFKFLKKNIWVSFTLIAIIVSICILPFIKIFNKNYSIPSLKRDDLTQNTYLSTNSTTELIENVLQFTPEFLNGLEDFNYTFPIGLVELICYDEACYMVVDGLWDWGYGPIPTRRLLTHSFDATIVTASQIKTDTIDFTAEESKNWPVRKDTILGPYLRVMAVAPFVTETLAMDKHNSQVLLIGLGGSSINNFFSNLINEPNITVIELQPAFKVIAKTWFGLVETPLHRVLIGDGAKFVRERDANESKFDVIFLDACHDIPENEVVCPVEIFHDDKIIYNLRKNINENGTLVINVVMMEYYDELLKNLLKKYETHFGSCYYAHINHQLVLTCTVQKLPRMNDTEYYRRYKENVPFDLQNTLMERVHVRQDLFDNE